MKTSAPTKPVRKRVASPNTPYRDEAFLLLMARFDRVDKDNRDIKASVSDHIKEDKQVHYTVAKHSTYWGLLITLGTPSVLAVVAWFKGLFS